MARSSSSSQSASARARARRAVIVGGVRTPFVKAFTDFTKMDTIALGDAAVAALLERFPVPRAELDALREDPGHPTRLRDALTTPRPNKAEAVAAIPELGNTENYPTTQSLFVSIYELHSRAKWRTVEAEQIADRQQTHLVSCRKEMVRLQAKVEAAEEQLALFVSQNQQEKS